MIVDLSDRLKKLRLLQAQIESEIVATEKRIGGTRKRQVSALCGTESGYYRHVRSDPKEKPCEPCKVAHRVAERARARRRAETRAG